MYDLAWFRANFDRIAERLQTRSNPPNLDGYRELDKRRRAAIAESEQLKARRNAETVEIGKLRREGVDTTERQQQPGLDIGLRIPNCCVERRLCRRKGSEQPGKAVSLDMRRIEDVRRNWPFSAIARSTPTASSPAA